MPTRPIHITGSNPQTGQLELTGHGHTVAERGDTILWIIGPQSGVTSIKSIQKKGGSDIFSIPPRPQGANWTGLINNVAPNGTTFVYFIEWTNASGTYKTDPIITIKPSTGGFTFFILKIAMAMLACLGLSLMFFKKKKNKK